MSFLGPASCEINRPGGHGTERVENHPPPPQMHGNALGSVGHRGLQCRHSLPVGQIPTLPHSSLMTQSKVLRLPALTLTPRPGQNEDDDVTAQGVWGN